MHCYTGCLRVMEWGSSFYAAYIVTGGQNVSSKCEPLDMKCDMSDGFDTDKSQKIYSNQMAKRKINQPCGWPICVMRRVHGSGLRAYDALRAHGVVRRALASLCARSAVSGPGAGMEAGRAAAGLDVRPADVLLDLRRQCPDRLFREVAAACFGILQGQAADRGQYGHVILPWFVRGLRGVRRLRCRRHGVVDVCPSGGGIEPVWYAASSDSVDYPPDLMFNQTQ